MAREMCERMKEASCSTRSGPDPEPLDPAQTLVQCATSENHCFFPYKGGELRAAFRSIGQALTYAQGSARLSN
jgi:hypothetical protein